MALPFLSPARTVLLIGDEFLSVYNVTFNSVRLAGSVPWQAEDFEPRVVRLIRHDCGGKPALLLNDMTDQHFKGGQRLPKVGPLDKQNVLDRKLEVAFPNYPLRGALAIKQTKEDAAAAREAADKGGATRSGGLYLFAAVSMSDPIVKTMDAVRRSMVSISGFTLLPVEASDMVAALSTKLTAKDREKSRWAIFIGQHRGGALRQVITRDGQLAMTRMTPVNDSERNPQDWAASVGQELKATISYLSRFGYGPEDGTDVIVIAAPEAGDALKDNIEIPCNYTSLTVNEAARILGLSIGLQDQPHFADPLEAAWIGRKSRFILPMKAKDLSAVVRPRQYAAVVTAALALCALYLGSQIFSEYRVLSAANRDYEEQAQALVVATSEQNIEVERMKALGFDVRLIQASMAHFNTLNDTSVEPLNIANRVGQALGPELRLDSLDIAMVDGAPLPADQVKYGPDGIALPPPRDMLATMTLTFPSTIDVAVGVREVNDLQRRLSSVFPSHHVSVSKQVADMVFTESTSGKVGMVGDGQATQDYIAELQIRGPVR